MQDLFPRIVVQTDETDANLRDFDDVLIAVFSLFMLFVALESQFLEIIFKK